MIKMFVLLLMAHALTDFSLQGEAMAKGKNRHNVPAYIPKGQKLVPCWYYWLSAHALISGAGVYVVTGSIALGCIEVGAHWITDFMKCENWTDPNIDQFLHIVCRVMYAMVCMR